VNGDWVGSLHLFANPPETDIPKPGAPSVIYFGPGIHELSHLVVTNNQTVYVAAGAVVRAVIAPDEPFQISGYSGLRNYSPTFVLRGTNIHFRGRGIVDGSHCPTHARNLLLLEGRDITLEGVILRDSSTWNMPIRQSERVTVKNLKILGSRANSDGIDICNSRDVRVEDCFVRTLDDLIVVKTDKGQGECRNITATNCVLWNEVAHALSIGAELRENVQNVVFSNCDVIHDKGREWTLRVYHCDSARISDVRFENLRIEESPRLISLWIDKAVWSRDADRGHIDGVTFSNIQAKADPLRVELKGFDEAHRIENVHFEHVVVNGKSLTANEVKTNAFVNGVTYQP
ncbi:MAG TPA: glycosyl hydrolase family 28 protein, partial [Terriglobales bacterium]|nr:glycosyl hydrolase family 28 protein [Terriglobales bacterium]